MKKLILIVGFAVASTLCQAQTKISVITFSTLSSLIMELKNGLNVKAKDVLDDDTIKAANSKQPQEFVERATNYLIEDKKEQIILLEKISESDLGTWIPCLTFNGIGKYQSDFLYAYPSEEREQLINGLHGQHPYAFWEALFVEHSKKITTAPGTFANEMSQWLNSSQIPVPVPRFIGKLFGQQLYHYKTQKAPPTFTIACCFSGIPIEYSADVKEPFLDIEEIEQS
ncbi:hypothetical protein HOD08_02820 [bacterium]|nr:hypothetical protein [bacterium]